MTALNNGYFKTDDMTIKALGGKAFPSDWWSRPYEYAFALKYTDKRHTVADMGCGWMGRPLTKELARQCKEVYAVDADPRVLELDNGLSNLYYVPFNFCTEQMVYFQTSSMDAIYCISVLEDLSPGDRLGALKNFKRIIKPNGKIIVTMDAIWETFRIAKPYPTVNIKAFIKDVNRAGLKFVGEVDPDMPDNAVHQSEWNLACFHAVLERK